MSDGHEPEVTLESIDGALVDLIKAAEATDLAKAYGGVAIDQNPHVDNRGQTTGGYPEKGDVGVLDSMMVGKMQGALIDAGFSADAIAAFMGEAAEVGKMGKPADMSGSVGTNPRVSPPAHGNTLAKMTGKQEDEEDEEDEEEEEGVGKSFDAFRSDPAIGDAIDVSPFLESLVQRTSERMDELGKSLMHQGARQDEVNKSMAVAVYGIGQLVKGMAPVLEALDTRLQLVERQPMPQKGHTNLTGAQPVRKSFGAGDGAPQLTKSQVLRTLSYLNLEKGMRDIGGRPTAEIIYQYEGGGDLSPQALQTVHQYLATHPNEAQVALTYR